MNGEELMKPSRKIKRWYFVVPGVAIVIIVIVGSVIWFATRQPSGTLPYPIPKSEAKQLGFDIYYPSQKLLPAGYTLNAGSFDTTNQVLIYSVSYGANQKIIFSDQAKPNSNQILQFVNDNIPLNTSLETNVGLATIGAIKTRAVISMPSNTDTWLIITAPGTINQAILNQVLKSIEIAR